MEGLTRRGFLTRTSAALAGVGVLVGVPGMSAATMAPEAPATEASAEELSEPMIAHISNFAAGEVSVLIGTREVIVQDAQLVTRLAQAARP